MKFSNATILNIRSQKFLLVLFLLGFAFQHGYGQSWQTLNASSLSWRFEDMFFISPEQGWVVDGGGQIMTTSNGGQNWTQQYHNSNFYFRSVEFLNSQLGFAGTLANGNPNAQLLKTTNGGQTWTDITSTLPVSIPGICGMSIVDENTLYITGVFYGSAYIMKSIDQGDSWQYMNMGAFANGLVDIYFKDENIGWAVGQSPQGTGLRATILGTTNGGITWNTLSTGDHVNQRAWKIQQLNDNTLFVSIEEFEPSPQFFKSVNGGQNWTLQNVITSNTSGTMQGIGFLTEDLGWIGGFSELFYETTDGGQNWTYKPNVGFSFNRFQRVNDTLMYSAGINVYRYADPTLLSIDEFEINRPKGHSIKVEHSNIVKNEATILLDLVNNTYCELSVYDSNGKRVQTIVQGSRMAGDHRIEWNTNNLSGGIYFLALYTYHGYESIRVIID